MDEDLDTFGDEAARKGRKPTNEELEARIEFTVGLVEQRLYKHQIRAALAERYAVCWRTADRYSACARDLIVKRANRSKTEFRSESLAFYENVLRTAKNVRDKLLAQQRIDVLLGLEAPKQVRVAGGDGEPIRITASRELSDAELAQIAAQGAPPHVLEDHSGNGRNGTAPPAAGQA